MPTAVQMIATSIGLLTDKYMLEATNFVEHFATEMKPNDSQQEFIKSSMYAGAIFGMVTFGPLSDIVGRRIGLISCSVITLVGALLSMFAWSAEALILARIITGIGMGGEYPLASTHSAESADGDGGSAVALLYLIGSGGGPVVCDMVTYFLAISGLPDPYVWRGIFLFGSLLSFIGLILRFVTTENSADFKKARNAKGTRRTFFRHYWRPLLGTSLIWLLFDIVEYGLKQNDAAIFSADASGPYSNSILTVAATRSLVIPSLVIAPMLLKRFSAKYVQIFGFVGCCVFNLVLAVAYDGLHSQTLLFNTLYIFQLSFQSLPGVSTMAIPANIFPSAVKGTGAAISAASGKIGATIGSFYFTGLAHEGKYSQIFWTVTCTSTIALVLTMILIPCYDQDTLLKAQELSNQGDQRAARRMLFSGPQQEGPKGKEGHCAAEDSGEKDSSLEASVAV